MGFLYSIIGGVVFILLSFIINKLLINRAVRKKIKPYLTTRNCQFKRIFSRGYFDTGLFKPKSSIESIIFIPGCSVVRSIYREVEYFDPNGDLKEMSVKIDNEFMILTNVYYCPQIE